MNQSLGQDCAACFWFIATYMRQASLAFCVLHPLLVMPICCQLCVLFTRSAKKEYLPHGDVVTMIMNLLISVNIQPNIILL
jgi:hypothetical protein